MVEEVHRRVEYTYEWPPITSVEDICRASVDDTGRPWVDGHLVSFTIYRQFCEDLVGIRRAE